MIEITFSQDSRFRIQSEVCNNSLQYFDVKVREFITKA